MSMLNWLRRWTSQSSVWPAIDTELEEARSLGLLNGKVLNAGAGWRDLSHLVPGELINQDIRWPGEARTNIQIYGPLHDIPVAEETFDTVICIAVLEHVENPENVVPEFLRVLKPGGHVVASVPFLQPEHKIPTDFQRYTRDGLIRLFEHHGFDVQSCRCLFSVFHTIHWIVYEWLHLKDTLIYKALRVLLLPPLAVIARRSRLKSELLASAFQVIARKPIQGL